MNEKKLAMLFVVNTVCQWCLWYKVGHEAGRQLGLIEGRMEYRDLVRALKDENRRLEDRLMQRVKRGYIFED